MFTNLIIRAPVLFDPWTFISVLSPTKTYQQLVVSNTTTHNEIYMYLKWYKVYTEYFDAFRLRDVIVLILIVLNPQRW